MFPDELMQMAQRATVIWPDGSTEEVTYLGECETFGGYVWIERDAPDFDATGTRRCRVRSAWVRLKARKNTGK